MQQDCTPGRYSDGKGTVNLFFYFYRRDSFFSFLFCLILFNIIYFFAVQHRAVFFFGKFFLFFIFQLTLHIYFHSPLLYIALLLLKAFVILIYNMFNSGFCPFLLDFIYFLLLAGFPCKLCPPGSFNNETRAQTCECCPDGFSSTYMKTSCRPCPANEWARHENFPNCSLCRTCFTPGDCEYLCLSLICSNGKNGKSVV